MSNETPQDQTADLDHVIDQASIALGSVIGDLAVFFDRSVAAGHRPTGDQLSRIARALAGAGEVFSELQSLRDEIKGGAA